MNKSQLTSKKKKPEYPQKAARDLCVLGIVRLLVICSLGFVLFAANVSAADLPLHLVKLPPGFKIELYADNIPNARSLTLGQDGTVFVGTKEGGKVYAVIKKDGKTEVRALVAGMRAPNGVAVLNDDLYIAEISRIWVIRDIEKKIRERAQAKPELVSADFPQDAWHGWKYIAFGPDGKLYVPVGAPCNVCTRDDLRYAALLYMNPDGSDLKLYARGIRNTVGFDWDPVTKELWFTDNGRDNLGDNIPPDELNHAPRPGLHFGFPFCHGGYLSDPEFGSQASCENFVPPAQRLGPHVASLGVKFYTGKMFPEEYRNQIFIAEHGSWNRSEKIGYRVSLVRLKDNKAVSYETFASGWLAAGKVWGRPVALLNMPDGALLVSDDHAGVVYRISYKKPK